MEGEGLNTAEQLKLHLASAFYSLRSTLRISKLRDLLSSASISPDSPVWLLGERYGAEGALPEQVGRSPSGRGSGRRRQNPMTLEPPCRPWRGCWSTSTPSSG